MHAGVSLGDMSQGDRAQNFHAHQAMTQRALVEIFGLSENEAALRVRELWAKFDDAPRQEQDLFLHNDPVAVACDLSGETWDDVDSAKLKAFNDSRRAAMEAG